MFFKVNSESIVIPSIVTYEADFMVIFAIDLQCM